jgi:hypothetical protein
MYYGRTGSLVLTQLLGSASTFVDIYVASLQSSYAALVLAACPTPVDDRQYIFLRSANDRAGETQDQPNCICTCRPIGRGTVAWLSARERLDIYTMLVLQYIGLGLLHSNWLGLLCGILKHVKIYST